MLGEVRHTEKGSHGVYVKWEKADRKNPTNKSAKGPKPSLCTIKQIQLKDMVGHWPARWGRGLAGSSPKGSLKTPSMKAEVTKKRPAVGKTIWNGMFPVERTASANVLGWGVCPARGVKKRQGSLTVVSDEQRTGK